MGFPIRKSMDQRVLSPPHGLSQSATSFIASYRQGIHQTPFSRLIRSSECMTGKANSAARPSRIHGSSSHVSLGPGEGFRTSLARYAVACLPLPAVPAAGLAQPNPMVSVLDLERLCLCCMRLVSHPGRRPGLRLERQHAGPPPLGNAANTSRVSLSER